MEKDEINERIAKMSGTLSTELRLIDEREAREKAGNVI